MGTLALKLPIISGGIFSKIVFGLTKRSQDCSEDENPMVWRIIEHCRRLGEKKSRKSPFFFNAGHKFIDENRQ